MKNNKGFTLVELIVTILVLGIITVIIVPIIKNQVTSSKQNSYNVMIQNIKTSASLYSTEFENDVRWFVLSGANNKETNEEWSCIQMSKLVDAGLVKMPVINPIDNTEINLDTLVEVRRDKTTHALKSDNVTLETELCNGGYDSTPPAIKITLKHEDGTAYTSGNWTDKNVIQKITVTDGNGISSLKLFSNGTEVTFPEKNLVKGSTSWTLTLSQTSDISANFEVTAKDYFNRSSNKTYSLNIDKTGPSCDIQLIGTKANASNLWYTSNVTVKLNVHGISAKDFQLSDSVLTNPTYPSSDSDKSRNVTENGTKNFYGYVKDKLGRTSSCEAVVKKDSVTPTAPTLASYPSTFIKGVSSPTAIPPTSATFGVAGGTTSCKCNGTACTNMSNVSVGSNSIVCTSTGNNGLSSTSSRTLTVRNCNSRSYCYTCGGYEYDECGHRITCPSCCECSSDSQCGTNYKCENCSCVYSPPATVCQCTYNYQCSYGYTCDGCSCVRSGIIGGGGGGDDDDDDDCTCNCGPDRRCDTSDCSCGAWLWEDYQDEDGCYNAANGLYCCTTSSGSYSCS